MLNLSIYYYLLFDNEKLKVVEIIGGFLLYEYYMVIWTAYPFIYKDNSFTIY